MALTADEQEKLVMLLVATAEVLGSEIKPTTAFMMAEDLSGYRFADLQAALAKCRRECSGRLTLKLVLECLQTGGVWISADEAWSLALKALDEYATVVWTKEIAQAWGIARPIANARDMVGARMAFRNAYERISSEAKAAGRPVEWQVSDGWDPNGREGAIQQAVDAGLLPAPVAAHHLPPPAPAESDIDQEGRARIGQQLKELAESLAIASKQQDAEQQERVLQWRREVEENHNRIRAKWLRELEAEEQKDAAGKP